MLQPQNDRLVVRPAPREISKIISVISDEPLSLGTVVAVGPGKKDKRGHRKALDVQVGDIIAFGSIDPDQNYFRNAFPVYQEMAQDGSTESFLILQEADICGVWQPAG